MTLQADRDQIAQFVTALYRHADEGTFISLRAFDQTRRDVPPFLVEGVKVNGSIEAIIERAYQAATRSANAISPTVFAPPVATFRTADSAKSGDVANGVAISVEIDGGDTTAKRRRLEHLLGPATVVMESGSTWVDETTGEIFPKIHIHWRLSEPTRTPDDHETLRHARRLAALLVDGDPTGAPPAHPLRMAGSWNLKATPRLARISGGNPAAEVHLNDALEALQDAMEAAGLASAGITPSAPPTAALPRLASAMAAIPNLDAHYDQWMRYGYALFRAGGDNARDLWDTWSRKSQKFDAGEQDAAWERIRAAITGSTPPRTIGAGTIFFDAAKAGWVAPAPEPPPAENDPAFWESLSRSLADPAEVAEVGAEVDFRHTNGTSASARKTSIIDPREWSSEPPPREWVVDGWIPRGYVTGLYGDGGIGKSLLAQQLLTSIATGRPWLGMTTVTGRAFGLMCEDDPDELHRRQADINSGMRLSMSDLGDLRYSSRVGADNLLMVFDEKNRGQPTEIMAQLCKYLEVFRPDIVLLDTLADTFGGDEIKRAHARQFVQGVGGNIARTFNCGVVIAAHPSQSGLASGKGTGGSTAWNNTFRSRLYLTRPEGEDNDSTRILSRMKANYASTDGAITLRWESGAFVVDQAKTAASGIDWRTINVVFKELDRAWNAGEAWSSAPQSRKDGRYFPMWMFTHHGVPERQGAKAIEQWMVAGLLRTEILSAKSKQRGIRVLQFPKPPDYGNDS